MSLQQLRETADRYTDKKYQPLIENMQKLHKQLIAIAASDEKQLKVLTLTAVNTRKLLDGDEDMSPEYYNNFAKSIQQGKHSPAFNMLGAMMLVLSATLLALGLSQSCHRFWP